MRFTSFTISNFKGINSLNIELNDIPQTDIITLVGLNESGKTTILEAIASFQINPRDFNSIIPKSRRANFNETISIEAKISMTAEDFNEINSFLSTLSYELSNNPTHIILKKEFVYLKSAFVSSEHMLVSQVNIKKIKRNSKKDLDIHELTKDELNTFTTFLINKLPKIVYYPNFLFTFPQSIYLEKYDNESSEQEFYRSVLQDVLDSLNQDLKLKDHLVDRKKSGTPNDLENIEKVLNEMSGKITKEVFETWGAISGIDVTNKSVTLGNDIKTEGSDETSKKYYIEIKVKEGTDSYYIRERSLGFRWFFAFLLFTQFRKYRKSEPKNTLFLLDEPASNLHQTGQQELLASLEKLTKGSLVIYSTHSHHLINPRWLKGAFIIRNKGLDPEKRAIEDDFNPSKTDITAEKYYKFVAKYPDEQAHYKPILDVLDYRPSKLENIPNIVITEGKNDYYTLKYFHEFILPNKAVLHINPGAGKDKHRPIISLYLSWGRPFIVLLDADKGGLKAKNDYVKEFGVDVIDKIFTLADVDSKFINLELEDLILSQDRIALSKSVFPGTSDYVKSQFNSALQQYYIDKRGYSFSKETTENFKKVVEFIQDRLRQPGVST